MDPRRKEDQRKSLGGVDDVKKYMNERQYLQAVNQYDRADDTDSDAGSYHYEVPSSP